MPRPTSGCCSRAALRVLGRLELHAAEVGRQVRAVAVSELPPLPMLMEPAVVERGNRHAEAILRAFVKHMRARRQEIDREFFRRAAVERAATGFPLELALHIYRICTHEVWRWLVREVHRIHGSEAVLIELTDGWFGFTNVGSAALTGGYVRFEADRIADRDRTLRDVVEELIVGSAGGRAALPVRARALGLDVTAAIQLVVAQSGAPEPHPLTATRDLLCEALRGSGGDIAAVVRGTEVIAVLQHKRRAESRAPAAPLKALTTAASATAIRVGISTLCDGLPEVPRGYEEASVALSLSSPTNPVVSFDDVRIFEYLLTRVDTSALRLIPAWVQRLGKPAGRVGGPLATTALAYLEAGFNVGKAARSLRVHPNTVHYRLRRVTEITGLNTRRFNDMLQLLTVIRLAERVGPSSGWRRIGAMMVSTRTDARA